jgi:hypothetical protein
MNMERSIVTVINMEFLRNENMEEKALFLEEEEELGEVKLYVMHVERHGTCLGNS